MLQSLGSGVINLDMAAVFLDAASMAIGLWVEMTRTDAIKEAKTIITCT